MDHGVPASSVFHYTDKEGWNAIRSQPIWRFKASQAKALDRPVGAYFTDIEPSEANRRTLYKRLRIPKTKQEYVFGFSGQAGLTRLFEGRGRDQRIYFSPVDYDVEEGRQSYEGQTRSFSEHSR